MSQEKDGSKQARDRVLTMRVHAAAADRLAEVAAFRGITVSDAMREALGEWVRANAPH